jgi:hypothetical protein
MSSPFSFLTTVAPSLLGHYMHGDNPHAIRNQVDDVHFEELKNLLLHYLLKIGVKPPLMFDCGLVIFFQWD